MEFNTQQAAFNSAQEYCRELTTIRKQLHLERMGEKWVNVIKLLESYFIALTPRMKDPKMLEKHMKTYLIIKEHHNLLLELIKSNKKTAPTKIFDDLKTWEMELRKDEDRLGLLMKDSGDPSVAIAQGNF